ncbi:hypothetical protein BGW37DRAFT_506522 [Umbelopsis sp. PMI_123]|nr:hypothetical protein BGW37DRAFT_506522 [Umbelopsis sp. PMI_123]
MVTRALPYEPKGPRIDQDDDDYSSDDINHSEKREKQPRKKTSSTQALVEFLNTTGPEEFQKQAAVPKRGSTLFFRRRKKSPARPPIPPSSGNQKKYVEIVTGYPLDMLGNRRLSKVPSLAAAKYNRLRQSIITPDGHPNGTPLPQNHRKQKESNMYSPNNRNYFSDLANTNIHENAVEPPHYMVKSRSDYSISTSDITSPAIPVKSSRRVSPPNKVRHGYALSSDSGMTFGNAAIWPADSPLSDDTEIVSGHSRTPSPQTSDKRQVDRSRSMDNLRVSNVSNASQESTTVPRRPRSKSGSLASQWPSSRSVGSPIGRSDLSGKARGRHRIDLVERALSQRIEAFRATNSNSAHSTPSEMVSSQLVTEHLRALQLSSVEQIEAVEYMSANTGNADYGHHQSILTTSSISPSHSNARGNLAILTERKKIRHVQVQTMDIVEKCKASTQTDSLIVVREGNNVAVGPSGEHLSGSFISCPSCSSIFHYGAVDSSSPNDLTFDRKKSYSTPTITTSQALKMYDSSPQRPASAGAGPTPQPNKTHSTPNSNQEDLQQQVTSLLHAVSELQSRLSNEQRAKKRLVAAMNDTNDKSELLNALAYKKLRELWEEKCRWEAACYAMQERFTQVDQLDVGNDRIWSRGDWNHNLYTNPNHVEESVAASQDRELS